MRKIVLFICLIALCCLVFYGCGISDYTLSFYTNSDEIIESFSTSNYWKIKNISLPLPEKEGYTFDGWYMDPSFNEEYDPNKLSRTDNILYAKWSPNTYRIIIHNELTDSEYVLFYLEEIRLEQPEKYDYTFDGFYEDAELTCPFELTAMPAKNIELYPKFKKNVHHYTFIYYDKEVEITQATIRKENADQYELLEPTKPGYSFEGWYTDPERTLKFDKNTLEEETIKLYALFRIIPYTVTVNCNMPNALTFSGGELQQYISDETRFDSISFHVDYGYKYLYYELNDEKFYENTIELDALGKDVIINIVCDYATYELPIINIDTNDQPILNKTDYVQMSFSMINSSCNLSDISGGIRLRGNTTMSYAKKPYRLKFDKKQSLFGLTKSKSWVLLADYLDPSCLHNYTALSLGNEMDNLAFTPTPNKVNVYLNGEYRGLYTLCEQVQENEGRINIEKDITADMEDLKDFNFFICMDYSVTTDVEAILDETYFYLEEYDRYFELKYPEKDDFITEDQFTSFLNQLKEYVKGILDAFSNGDIDSLETNCNLDSLIDYCLIDQIMGDNDHYWKSFNMYFTTTSSETENNKLNFGPIWDYDWCLNTPWTGNPNVFYMMSDEIDSFSMFFKFLLQNEEMLSKMQQRYTGYTSGKLGDLITNIISFSDSIRESIKLNASLWYEDDVSIAPDNISFLIAYLKYRKNLLDEAWGQ